MICGLTLCVCLILSGGACSAINAADSSTTGFHHPACTYFTSRYLLVCDPWTWFISTQTSILGQLAGILTTLLQATHICDPVLYYSQYQQMSKSANGKIGKCLNDMNIAMTCYREHEMQYFLINYFCIKVLDSTITIY